MAGNDVYKLNTSYSSFVYMAKLYWRIKRNGKWTWRPLRVDDQFTQTIIDRLATQDGILEEEE